MKSADRYYSAYGHTLRTTENFDGLLPPSVGPAGLEYLVSRDDEPPVCGDADALYRSLDAGVDGTPRLQVWRSSEQSSHYRLRRSGVGTYDLTPTSITCYPRCDVERKIAVIHLLGSVMSLRLESEGTPALHASAVAIDGHAVGFLSYSGSGKSTLAASFVQSGYPLLTDDVLPVERCGGVFTGRPGYPQMRLWPDEARHFLGSCEDLELVHPALSKRRVPLRVGGLGAFCDESKPVLGIYGLERRDPDDHSAEIEIRQVPLRDALMDLVRHSFLAPVVEALGWQPDRLDFFAEMLRHVPIRRIVYPSTVERLPDVRHAILEDLGTFQRSRSS